MEHPCTHTPRHRPNRGVRSSYIRPSANEHLNLWTMIFHAAYAKQNGSSPSPAVGKPTPNAFIHRAHMDPAPFKFSIHRRSQLLCLFTKCLRLRPEPFLPSGPRQRFHHHSSRM
ncbi:hypothetical protein JTE90_015557 [Oedothorax gibbosus]|uniref:Uncharacterized protein n=1 Tax=Oedothorax gibbosus TaxID=931172 RepID=A0AAV6TV35_9ARAC|nr:hypothetical protein JTE90_015557 [Oedothorax gibbosus]